MITYPISLLLTGSFSKSATFGRFTTSLSLFSLYSVSTPFSMTSSLRAGQYIGRGDRRGGGVGSWVGWSEDVLYGFIVKGRSVIWD